MTHVRAYLAEDIPAMIDIWNEVVEDGIAFPQEETLDLQSGETFFATQTHCGVAIDDGRIIGLYILHPNNVGRCGHIANASYAVSSAARGRGAGRALVEDSLAQGKAHGFRILQFNAVVATNAGARHLYEKLGFTQLGTIPNGFRLPDGTYADICPYYHEL
jgi:L-amino acid N-acyltransferase YncA